MCLLYFFIISCSPISYTFQTETVRAILQYTKSFSIFKYFFKTNHAFSIPIIFNFFISNRNSKLTFKFGISWSHAFRMHKLTVISIFTIPLQKIFTNNPVFIIFQKVINYLIIIFQIRNSILLASSNFQNFSNFLGILII